MFKDFAVFTSGTQDPVSGAYVYNGTSATSGTPGNPWGRSHMSFFPDSDSKYLAVGARIDNVALATPGSEDVNSQYITNWMLERAPSNWQPSTFSPAHEIQVNVRPDRINLVLDPTFDNAGAAKWAYFNSVRQAGVGVDAGAAARLTSTGADSTSAYIYQITAIPVVPGETYTFSAAAKRTVGTPNLRMVFETGIGVVLSAPNADVTRTLTTDYDRYSQTVVIPAGVTSIYPYLFCAANATGNQVEVDQIQFEKGPAATPFFHGGSGNDYLWESGGTAHAARSYYYESRLDRIEAIRRALRDATPMGIPVGEPVFGVWPG